MRKWTFALMAVMLTPAAGLVGIAPEALYAQTKIGIMDFDRAVQESERGKVAQAELEAYYAELSMAIQTTQDQLNGMQQRYQTQQRALSEAALAQLELDINRLNTQLNRQAEDAELEMTLKQQELFNPVYNDLATIVQEFVEAEGYTLVLPPDAVIYATPTSDITAPIIERYNAAHAASAPATTPPAAPAPDAEAEAEGQ